MLSGANSTFMARPERGLRRALPPGTSLLRGACRVCAACRPSARHPGAEEAATAPEWARTGLSLGWEGAPGLRLEAANHAPGLGSSCGARGALAGAPHWAQGWTRGVTWQPARARRRRLLQLRPRPGISTGLVDSTGGLLCARLQHPPLNPPLPPRVSAAGKGLGSPTSWRKAQELGSLELGTHLFVGLCSPHHPQTLGPPHLCVSDSYTNPGKLSLIHSKDIY